MIRYERKALADLESIHRYLHQFDHAAASGVITRISKSIQRLDNFPLSARPGPRPGTRLLVVPGLPYIVTYRVRGPDVHIIAVMHGARRR